MALTPEKRKLAEELAKEQRDLMRDLGGSGAVGAEKAEVDAATFLEITEAVRSDLQRDSPTDDVVAKYVTLAEQAMLDEYVGEIDKRPEWQREAVALPVLPFHPEFPEYVEDSVVGKQMRAPSQETMAEIRERMIAAEIERRKGGTPSVQDMIRKRNREAEEEARRRREHERKKKEEERLRLIPTLEDSLRVAHVEFDETNNGETA